MYSTQPTLEVLLRLCNYPLLGWVQSLGQAPQGLLGMITPLEAAAVNQAAMLIAPGQEAGGPPPVSEPPSTQREPLQEDGSPQHSSCALPPTLKSSPCLSTTLQLMQARSRHLTMINSMLGATHLTPTLPVGASQTGLQWAVTGTALALLLVAPLSSGRASLPRHWMHFLLQSIVNRVTQ